MEIGGVDSGRLRGFVRRYEQLQEEIDALNEDRGELMKDLAGSGFDKKAFKIVIKRRRMGSGAVAQEDLFVQLYERAIDGPAPEASSARAREDDDVGPSEGQANGSRRGRKGEAEDQPAA